MVMDVSKVDEAVKVYRTGNARAVKPNYGNGDPSEAAFLTELLPWTSDYTSGRGSGGLSLPGFHLPAGHHRPPGVGDKNDRHHSLTISMPDPLMGFLLQRSSPGINTVI